MDMQIQDLKASDLRIGNLLYGVIAPRVVKSISPDYYEDAYGNSTLIRDAKPIPLTEEWLVRMGGVCIGQDHDHSGWSIEDIIIMLYSNYVIIDLGQIHVRCNFVHEFQNVIHALTGQELIIKTI